MTLPAPRRVRGRARPALRPPIAAAWVAVAGGVGLPAAGATGQTITAASAYVDRVIDPATLPTAAETDEPDPSGVPRGLRLDQSLLSQRGDGRLDGFSTAFQAFADLPNHGALSLAATLLSQRGAALSEEGGPSRYRATSWRLDQRALPLAAGWRANHSLGATAPYALPLSQGLGQLPLPVAPLRGFAGEWVDHRGDTHLVAAGGRNGYFTGLDSDGFRDVGATVATIGAQHRLSGGDRPEDGRWDAALQYMDARDQPVTGFAIDDAPVARHAVRSLWAALAWQGRAPWAERLGGAAGVPVPERAGGLRLQANLLRSESSVVGRGGGAWLESAWAGGGWRQRAGVYTFDPSLYWGGAQRTLDLRGAYLRAETGTRRWQFGFGGETSEHVSSPARPLQYANVHGLYRLGPRDSVGASVTATAGSIPARSLRLQWNRDGPWGRSQWHGEYARQGGGDAGRVRVDHAWPSTDWWSLSTSLGYERRSVSGLSVSGAPVAADRAVVWGLVASASPRADLRLDASLRGANGSSSASRTVGVDATWSLTRRWSVGLRYAESTGREAGTPFVVSGLDGALQALRTPAFESRTLQLTLRFQDTAGTAFAPLGGGPGTGYGTLGGTVYFDEDGNGMRTATERGAAGVTVILDRRFVTRTGADGRYVFPAVAAGSHQIEIQPDQVPLPWSPATREPVSTTVAVRGDAVTDFALRRQP